MTAHAFTDVDKLQELRREIAMRRRVYARQVQLGRMTVEGSHRAIAVMEAIAADYEVQSDLLKPGPAAPLAERLVAEMKAEIDRRAQHLGDAEARQVLRILEDVARRVAGAGR